MTGGLENHRHWRRRVPRPLAHGWDPPQPTAYAPGDVVTYHARQGGRVVGIDIRGVRVFDERDYEDPAA